MDRVRDVEIKMNNRGSSVVEISLIMPIIFGVLVLVLFLFLDTIKDGLVQQDGYCIIYTYKKESDAQSESGDPVKEQEEGTGHITDGRYRYENNGHVFITETDVCTDRLRRWQVYGNIVWE